MPNGNFDGLRVLALESRRATEIAKLIVNCGGEPLVAPSVREILVESSQSSLDFVSRLRNGEVDMVIFMTGAGVRALVEKVEGTYSRQEISKLLNEIAVVARGPKPVAALRELGVQATLSVPEPNTWRDLLAMLDSEHDAFPLQGRRIALQEYGVANPELVAGLEERGATVLPLIVYQWVLPEDIGPLKNAVAAIMRGEIHVMLVASSIQVRHLFQVAETIVNLDDFRKALTRVVIASIGPLTSEELRNHGLNVDLQCSHPKMGFLVQEAAQQSPELSRAKHE